MPPRRARNPPGVDNTNHTNDMGGLPGQSAQADANVTPGFTFRNANLGMTTVDGIILNIENTTWSTLVDLANSPAVPNSAWKMAEQIALIFDGNPSFISDMDSAVGYINGKLPDPIPGFDWLTLKSDFKNLLVGSWPQNETMIPNKRQIANLAKVFLDSAASKLVQTGSVPAVTEVTIDTTEAKPASIIEGRQSIGSFETDDRPAELKNVKLEHLTASRNEAAFYDTDMFGIPHNTSKQEHNNYETQLKRTIDTCGFNEKFDPISMPHRAIEFINMLRTRNGINANSPIRLMLAVQVCVSPFTDTITAFLCLPEVRKAPVEKKFKWLIKALEDQFCIPMYVEPAREAYRNFKINYTHQSIKAYMTQLMQLKMATVTRDLESYDYPEVIDTFVAGLPLEYKEPSLQLNRNTNPHKFADELYKITATLKRSWNNNTYDNREVKRRRNDSDENSRTFNVLEGFLRTFKAGTLRYIDEVWRCCKRCGKTNHQAKDCLGAEILRKNDRCEKCGDFDHKQEHCKLPELFCCSRCQKTGHKPECCKQDLRKREDISNLRPPYKPDQKKL